MKKLLFILLLFVSAAAIAQPSKFTPINQNYEWLGGNFKTKFGIPRDTFPVTGKDTAYAWLARLGETLWVYSDVQNKWIISAPSLVDLQDVNDAALAHGFIPKWDTLTDKFIFTPDQTGVGGSGITELNGDVSSVQSFSEGTSGTDFNINTSSGVHTFNLPTVSGSARGLVPSSLFNTWNAKIGPGDTSAMLEDYLIGIIKGEIAYNWGDHAGLYSLLGHTHSGLAPSGGSAGQVLTKIDGTGYNYSWQTPPTASQWNGIVAGVYVGAAGVTMTSAFQDYVYTGTGGHTFTLPSLTGNNGRGYFVKNRGSGTLTVSRAGSDQLYDASAVNTITIDAGSWIFILSDGAYWNVHKPGSGGGSGEANTMSNAGSGLTIFNTKSGVDFPMKTLTATDFDISTNDISLDATLKAKWDHAYDQTFKTSSISNTIISGYDSLLFFPSDSAVQAKAIRIQLNGTTVTPTVTDSTISWNILSAAGSGTLDDVLTAGNSSDVNIELTAADPSSGNINDSPEMILTGKGNNSGTVNSRSWKIGTDVTTTAGLGDLLIQNRLNAGSWAWSLRLTKDNNLTIGTLASIAALQSNSIATNGSTVNTTGSNAFTEDGIISSSNSAILGGQNTQILAGANSSVSVATDSYHRPGAEYAFTSGDAHNVWGYASSTHGFGNYNYNEYGFVAGNDNILGETSTTNVDASANDYQAGSIFGSQNISYGGSRHFLSGRALQANGANDIIIFGAGVDATLTRLNVTTAKTFNVGFHSTVPTFQVTSAFGSGTYGLTIANGGLKVGTTDASQTLSDGIIRYTGSAFEGRHSGVWVPFQAALTGTGFVKSTAGVISYDNSTYLTGTTAVTTFSGGTTGFTPSTATSGTITLAGTLDVDNGGTGATTLTGVVIGSGTSAMTAVAGTASQLLRRNAANNAYEFFTPDYQATLVSGTNIKTINGNSLLGSGNLILSGSSQWTDQSNGISYTSEVMIGGTTDLGTYPLQVTGQGYFSTGIYVPSGEGITTSSGGAITMRGSTQTILNMLDYNLGGSFTNTSFFQAGRRSMMFGGNAGEALTRLGFHSWGTVFQDLADYGIASIADPQGLVHLQTVSASKTMLYGKGASSMTADYIKILNSADADVFRVLSSGYIKLTAPAAYSSGGYDVLARNQTTGFVETVTVSGGSQNLDQVLVTGNTTDEDIVSTGDIEAARMVATSSLNVDDGTASIELAPHAGSTGVIALTLPTVSGQLARVAQIPTNNNTLTNGAGYLSTVNNSNWSGTQLSVGNGGTGATTLTGVIVGNGTSAMTAVTGTANQLLRRNAGNTAYEFFTPTYLTSETQTWANVMALGNTTTANPTLLGSRIDYKDAGNTTLYGYTQIESDGDWVVQTNSGGTRGMLFQTSTLGAIRTYVMPDANETIQGAANASALSNKTIDATTNTITNLVRSATPSIISPTASEQILLFQVGSGGGTAINTSAEPSKVTLRGTSPSVTYAIHYGTTYGTSAGTIVASNTVNTTGATSITIGTAAIPANAYVWLVTTAVSGTIDEFTVHLKYRH